MCGALSAKGHYDVFRRSFNTNLSSISYLNMENNLKKKLAKQTGLCQWVSVEVSGCLKKLYFIKIIEFSVSNIRKNIYYLAVS